MGPGSRHKNKKHSRSKRNHLEEASWRQVLGWLQGEEEDVVWSKVVGEMAKAQETGSTPGSLRSPTSGVPSSSWSWFIQLQLWLTISQVAGFLSEDLVYGRTLSTAFGYRPELHWMLGRRQEGRPSAHFTEVHTEAGEMIDLPRIPQGRELLEDKRRRQRGPKGTTAFVPSLSGTCVLPWFKPPPEGMPTAR